MFEVISFRCLTAVLALLIDACLGDHRRNLHIVTIMGKLINVTERTLNRPEGSKPVQRTRGCIVTAMAITFAMAVAVGMNQLTQASDVVGGLLEIMLVSHMLAGRSLYDHVAAVQSALGEPPTTNSNDISEAKTALSRIVGRDTSSLNRSEIIRAALESLSENTSDGVVGPLVAYVTGGPFGIIVYKFISTADSMIGHRTQRFLSFGWCSARADDLINWVPARLTAANFALTHALRSRRILAGKQVWQNALRDGPNHASPNAGWPEAALATMIDVRLGGTRYYFDEGLTRFQCVNGAYMNPNGRSNPGTGDLMHGLRCYVLSMALFTMLLAGCGVIVVYCT